MVAHKSHFSHNIPHDDRAIMDRKQRMLAETLRWAGSIVLSSTLNYDEVLDRVLEQVHRITAHDASCIMLINAEHAHVSRWAGYAGFGSESAIASMIFEISDIPQLSQSWQSGLPVVVSETSPDDPWLVQSGQQWVKSYVTIPIRNVTPP